MRLRAITGAGAHTANTAAGGRLFMRGGTYRQEMFEYRATGRGTEGDHRVFVPVHLGRCGEC
jgi:hypothetical protein